MADTIFGSGTGPWVCPNDRQLALRAKLQTGWSVHTFQTEKQRKMQALSPQELEVILEVIRKAEKLDLVEQQRVGRLVERLENMRKNALGNGLSQCLLCSELLGLLGSTAVFCQHCRKKVCTKCGIETVGSQKRPLWLCKICSEQRERFPATARASRSSAPAAGMSSPRAAPEPRGTRPRGRARARGSVPAPRPGADGGRDPAARPRQHPPPRRQPKPLRDVVSPSSAASSALAPGVALPRRWCAVPSEAPREKAASLERLGL